MHNNVHHLSQYSGDIWQVFFLDFFLLPERCGLVLCEGFTVRLLRGVSVAHVVLVEGAAIRVPGEVFPDLFSGNSLEGLVLVEGVASLVLVESVVGLVPVEGITGLVLREVALGLMLGEVVARLMPGEVAAGVIAEEGSVGLTTVEDLASLVPGEISAGLAPGELPEEGIAGLVVGSTLTAHSKGSVGRPREDGRR